MIQDFLCRALDAWRERSDRYAEEHPGGSPALVAALIAACVILTGAVEAV